jgi:hypothetical protein
VTATAEVPWNEPSPTATQREGSQSTLWSTSTVEGTVWVDQVIPPFKVEMMAGSGDCPTATQLSIDSQEIPCNESIAAGAVWLDQVEPPFTVAKTKPLAAPPLLTM